jgi:hypothetical protein
MTGFPDPNESDYPGPLWAEMDARPRVAFSELTRAAIPISPGVYAVYRDGCRVYVGKAADLRSRVSRHNGKGLGMRGSAFRRNVAQFLGIAEANHIYKQVHRITADEAQAIRDWIEGCEVAWFERPTESEALAAETEIKAEFKPPLTKV